MNDVINFLKTDFVNFFCILFVILSGSIAIYDVIGKFSEMINKPVKWVKKKNEDHETIECIEKRLDIIEKQQEDFEIKQEEDVQKSIEHDNKIERRLDEFWDKLNIIEQNFIDERVANMRIRILDFCSSIRAGREFTEEQYVYILSTISKYDDFIKANNLTNGQVDASVKIIKEEYDKRLREGFKF